MELSKAIFQKMLEIKKYIQGKVVFLGVGNSMRGDDGLGDRFIEELRKSKKSRSSQIYLFKGAQVPENYLEPIAKIKPDRIFIVDALDFGASPGKVRLFKEVGPQSNFSTHALSLNFILDYLRKRTEAEVFILGIQPAQLQWGATLSPEVEATVKELVNQLS